MSFEQQHNFKSHWCDFTNRRMYLGACQGIIRRLTKGEDRNLWPDCTAPCASGHCPAKQMIREDFARGLMSGPLHYVDRDDLGPGIAKRRDLGLPERPAEVVAQHHEVLRELGIKPYMEPELTDKQQRALDERRPQKPVSVFDGLSFAKPVEPPKPAPPTSLDIGDMINRVLGAA